MQRSRLTRNIRWLSALPPASGTGGISLGIPHWPSETVSVASATQVTKTIAATDKGARRHPGGSARARSSTRAVPCSPSRWAQESGSAVGRRALGDLVNYRNALEPGPQLRVAQGCPHAVDNVLRRPIGQPRAGGVAPRREEAAPRGVIEPLLARLPDLEGQGEGAAQRVLGLVELPPPEGGVALDAPGADLVFARPRGHRDLQGLVRMALRPRGVAPGQRQLAEVDPAVGRVAPRHPARLGRVLHDVHGLVEDVGGEGEIPAAEEAIGLVDQVEGHALESGGVAAPASDLQPPRAERQPGVERAALHVQHAQGIEEAIDLDLVAELLAKLEALLEGLESGVVVAQTRPRHPLGEQASSQDGQELRMLAPGLDALAAEGERLLVSPVPVPEEAQKAQGAVIRDVAR